MTVTKAGIKIRKVSIYIFLLLFPHMRPESLAYIAPKINMLYNVGRLVSFGILLFLFVYKRVKPSPLIKISLLLQLWIVLTTYLNHGDVQRAVITMMSALSFMMIVELYCRNKMINPLISNFEWMIYVNLGTVILFPGGIYQRGIHGEFVDFFLGFKNAFFPYCIIAILLAGFNYLQKQQSKIRALLLMIASFLNVMLAWSASSVVAIAAVILMFILIVVIQRPRLLTKLRFKTLIIIYFIVDVFVCVFNMVENIPLITYFVANVLHKTETLSGRTVIWELALQHIKEKPLIGYGIGEHITWRGYNWYGHNQIFEMLMEGGIPCLLFYIIIICLIVKKMDLCKNKLVYNMMISVFSGTFVFFIAEAGVSPLFYLFFAIAYHINEIVIANGINSEPLSKKVHF